MASISLRHIYKSYPDGIDAVWDFNLEIQDKEFIILVGPSGCGKTTTLRMIAGLEEISQGEIFIGDQLVNDVAPKDRDIAMVFQSYALYPHMTVYKNMAFGLELRKVPKEEIRRRVTEAARALDIEPLLNRRPRALSGGQRQRVALGRAMVREPAVFLLDEPLSNLDAALRTQMRTEITRLHQRLGTTFVYVTHDQTEAMTMADRIVVMKDGIIQQVDTPQTIYRSPRNRFVAGFIGSPQMNFVPVTIEKTPRGYAARLGAVSLDIPENLGNLEALSSYIGRDLTLGIRPEDLSEAALAPLGDYPTLLAEVEIAEMMGAEIYLHVLTENGALTARVPPRAPYKSGDQVSIVPDMEHAYFFDNETGNNIMIE